MFYPVNVTLFVTKQILFLFCFLLLLNSSHYRTKHFLTEHYMINVYTYVVRQIWMLWVFHPHAGTLLLICLIVSWCNVFFISFFTLFYWQVNSKIQSFLSSCNFLVTGFFSLYWAETIWLLPVPLRDPAVSTRQAVMWTIINSLLPLFLQCSTLGGAAAAAASTLFS